MPTGALPQTAPIDDPLAAISRIVKLVEDGRVIVVVEGPSAAGKTTWCRRSGFPVVDEYIPTGLEPDRSDLSVQAAYWTEVNCARWAQARALEANNPVVVCDSDPLKLHYSWCLNRVSAAPRDRFTHELAATRRAFAADRLGFADLVLTVIPPLATLREHRAADPGRPRRSFELHAQLSDPLRQWYQTLDVLNRAMWPGICQNLTNSTANCSARAHTGPIWTDSTSSWLCCRDHKPIADRLPVAL